MISKKTTTPTWIVPLCDPALRDAKIKMSSFVEYAKTRDLKRINCSPDGVLADTGESVTMFSVVPLKQKFIHLLDTPGKFANIVIFQACVTGAKNIGDLPWSLDDGKVSEEFCESIGQDIVDDVASFVIDQCKGANGTDVPFSLPVGWREERLKSQDLRALFANTGNAKPE